MKCYLLLWLIGSISLANALECELSFSENQEDVKKYTNICVMKATKKVEDNIYSSRSYDASYEDEVSPEDVVDDRRKILEGFREESMSNVQNDENLNETEISGTCIAQCVFKHLGMVDSSGYPDHMKISENLLKDVNNRELKDFLADSTNECFQMAEQEEHIDNCQFSTQLIKCLAEKGRSNCADWPMTDLPLEQSS